jgi:hypothetical protein
MHGLLEEVLFPIGVVVGAVVLLIILVIGVPLELIHRHQCNNYSEVTGKRTDYRVLDSCYVETAEGWQRWDEYKNRAIASEGLKGAAK